MIPQMLLNLLSFVMYGEDVNIVFNGRVVILKSTAHEAVRANGFTG